MYRIVDISFFCKIVRKVQMKNVNIGTYFYNTWYLTISCAIHLYSFKSILIFFITYSTQLICQNDRLMQYSHLYRYLIVSKAWYSTGSANVLWNAMSQWCRNGFREILSLGARVRLDIIYLIVKSWRCEIGYQMFGSLWSSACAPVAALQGRLPNDRAIGNF